MRQSHLAKVALLNEEKEHNLMNIKLLFNTVEMEANQCVRVQAISKMGLVTYASCGGFLAMSLIVNESVNVLELWDFSSSKTEHQVHILKKQLISIDVLVKEGKVYIAELDDRRVLQVKYWGGSMIMERRLGMETSSIKLLDEMLVLFSKVNSTIHLLKWNGEIIDIIEQEIGDILKIDGKIIVQSHPNMTEIDVQKGTAMDLQGRAIRLGDNSIGYVIDNKLHYEELEYDINPLYASDQVFGIIFVDQNHSIRLLDKKSKAVRESSIPTSIEQKIFICINQNLVFGDAMGDLYFIDRIMDYFN